MTTFEPVRYAQGRPMLLGGLRRQHPYSAPVQALVVQWQQFEALLPLPGQAGATTYGVMCGHDGRQFEYMCGVEVGSFDELPRELGRMRVREQQYAVFLHGGPVTAIRETWEHILNEWLPASAWQSANAPAFERYDERFDPRTGTGEVEIWVSVAPKPPAGAEP